MQDCRTDDDDTYRALWWQRLRIAMLAVGGLIMLMLEVVFVDALAQILKQGALL